MSDHLPVIGLVAVLIIFGMLCLVNPAIGVSFVILLVGVSLYVIFTSGKYPNLRK